VTILGTWLDIRNEFGATSPFNHQQQSNVKQEYSYLDIKSNAPASAIPKSWRKMATSAAHLALFQVQFAKAKGYKVVAVDTRDAPIELVKSLPERFQPDLTLNPLHIDKDKVLQKLAENF